jgi:hypothetical protein
MWGAGGPFLPAAAMVGYGCDGHSWPLEANVRSVAANIESALDLNLHEEPLNKIRFILC